jgi:hypothetical protein
MGRYLGRIQKFIHSVAPWYLQNDNIGAFLQAVGITLDASISDLQTGLELSQPLLCDPSALPSLARDRNIRVYPGESDASKRMRLATWLQLHRQRGTHQGELRHVQPYFLPDLPMMRMVHQSGDGQYAGWHTLASDGTYSRALAHPSNWDYDGNAAQWSRFWCILYAPLGAVQARYDDGGTYDSAERYDVLTTQVGLDVLAMITEWKSAHSAFWGLVVASDPLSFSPLATATADPSGWTSLPVGNWGSPVDNSGRYTRPPSAFWLYDRGQS